MSTHDPLEQARQQEIERQREARYEWSSGERDESDRPATEEEIEEALALEAASHRFRHRAPWGMR